MTLYLVTIYNVIHFIIYSSFYFCYSKIIRLSLASIYIPLNFIYGKDIIPIISIPVSFFMDAIISEISTIINYENGLLFIIGKVSHIYASPNSPPAPTIEPLYLLPHFRLYFFLASLDIRAIEAPVSIRKFADLSFTKPSMISLLSDFDFISTIIIYFKVLRNITQISLVLLYLL